MNDKYEIAELLLKAGADINAKDKWGKNAYQLAESLNNSKMLKLLDQYNK